MGNPAGTAGRKFRILSLDGGGIYGMFTDLMLKQLKSRYPAFLTGDSINLFAGTSAGAVNSCFLAMHDDPADGLDTAIAFWGEGGIYNNTNLFDWLIGSTFGLSPYYGTADYKGVLEKYFGDRTLGDLAHPVVIVTWDWSGEPAPDGDPRNRHWRPKIYCNFPDDNPDRAAKLVDVAFMAGAPSWFRCIYQGRQDGGWIAPNPAFYAVTKVINTLSHARYGGALGAARLSAPFQPFIAADGFSGLDKHYGLRELMSVFSLGVGAHQPFLPVSYANWGKTQWMNGMWNPYMGRWVSPMVSIGLDGPTDAVDAQCRLLLNLPGRLEGFYRLNPQVLETPVMDVLIHLRNNPYYLEYVKTTIHSAVGKAETQQALELAGMWLEQAGWNPAPVSRVKEAAQ